MADVKKNEAVEAEFNKELTEEELGEVAGGQSQASFLSDKNTGVQNPLGKKPSTI